LTLPDGRPTVPEASALARWYSDLPDDPDGPYYHSSGGICHIVLADENVESFWGPELLKDALDYGDYFGAFLVAVLFRMTVTQRRKVAKRWEWR
jgi:hypothetical protein